MAGLIRVLALLPYPTDQVPGQRFRIEQWEPQLFADGVHLQFSAFLPQEAMGTLHRRGHNLQKMLHTIRGYSLRIRQLRDLEQFDCVYVYREAALLGREWLERRIARKVPIVFDFDDAIYLPATSDGNPLARFLKWPGKTAAICGLARHVIVGNEMLAEFARQHARDVSVIPTTIDTASYTPVARAENGRPVVGWSGSTTTVPYLEAIKPALTKLRGLIDYELRVIGGSISLPGVDVRSSPWTAETEVEGLRSFDVGLMPLPDDEWSRGKCGLKALQYMALGIPAVVSPVGVNTSIVREGIDGFYARSDEDWANAIGQLLRDPILRDRMGANARRRVEEAFSARVQVPRVAQVLRGAIGRQST